MKGLGGRCKDEEAARRQEDKEDEEAAWKTEMMKRWKDGRTEVRNNSGYS